MVGKAPSNVRSVGAGAFIGDEWRFAELRMFAVGGRGCKRSSLETRWRPTTLRLALHEAASAHP